MINVAKFDTTKTERLRDGLQAYRKEYDEKMQRFKDNDVHDWASDIADSFRYMAIAYAPACNTTIGNAIIRNIKVKRAYG
jgi:hypothetical protein